MKKLLIIFFVVIITQKNMTASPQGGGNDIVALYNANEYLKVIEFVKKKNADEITAADWYYAGLSYLQIRNIKEAVDVFERCLKMDSTNIGYRLQYSRALNQKGRINDAVKNYEMIIEKDSSNAAALYDLGLIFINRKDFISARSIFEKLSKSNTTDFLSAYYFAFTFYQTAVTSEDTVKAGDYIFKAKLLNFEYIPTFELSGIYYLNLGDYERAIYDYSMLTQLNPLNAEYFYRAGFCLEKTKNYKAAIGFFNKAVEKDSSVTNYFSHLGYVYFMAEEYDSSISAYAKSTVLVPDDPSPYLNLGLVYEKIDSLGLAKTYYEKALQLYPYGKIVFNTEKLISIDYRLKNYEQVQLLCQQVLAIAPASVQSLFYSACSYDAEGETNLALIKYKDAAAQLKKEDKYKSEYKYVIEQIEKINEKVQERKFWEGKYNEQ